MEDLTEFLSHLDCGGLGGGTSWRYTLGGRPRHGRSKEDRGREVSRYRCERETVRHSDPDEGKYDLEVSDRVRRN